MIFRLIFLPCLSEQLLLASGKCGDVRMLRVLRSKTIRLLAHFPYTGLTPLAFFHRCRLCVTRFVVLHDFACRSDDVKPAFPSLRSLRIASPLERRRKATLTIAYAFAWAFRFHACGSFSRRVNAEPFACSAFCGAKLSACSLISPPRGSLRSLFFTAVGRTACRLHEHVKIREFRLSVSL